MKRSLSVAPSTSTSPVVVAKRAFSDGDAPTQDEETIDLVYPFDWPSISNSQSGGENGGNQQGTNIPIDPNGPITMTNFGLNVRTTPPISVIMGSLYLKYNSSDLGMVDGRLAINCSPPLTRTNGGIGVNIGSGLINSNGSLSINLNQQGGIAFQNGGIGLNINNSNLELDNSLLSVKLNPSSCIVSSSDGISLNIDAGAFEIQQGTLYLKANPQYLSPYTICTLGNPTLIGSNFVSSDRRQLWNCQSYFYMVYSAGLVNCISNIKVNSDNTDSSSSSSINKVSFTIVLTTSQIRIQNISGLSPLTIVPSSAQPTLFYPYGGVKQSSYVEITNPSFAGTNANWYLDPNSPGFKSIQFIPMGNGCSFDQSTFNYGQITITDSTGAGIEAIGITLVMNVSSGSNWYGRGATLTTGTISFSYQGQIPNGL
ncbi:protein fiber1 [Goose adenovirus 4]|nr:protein fiber1 [Goose adenovirus 4]